MISCGWKVTHKVVSANFEDCCCVWLRSFSRTNLKTKVLEETVGEPCPEDDWNEFIPRIDSDNSGTVSFAEFLHALYHWFAEVDIEAEEDDAEKDETDEVFSELKRIYTRAKERSGSKNLSEEAMVEAFAALDTKQATPKNVQHTMDKVRREMEGKEGQFVFKDFLYGASVLLLGEEDDDDRASGDEGAAGKAEDNRQQP